MGVLLEIDREVEVGDQKSSRFGIDFNGKAFKVLINSIYADKIQSIVREIWSNCLDGHTMAGKEHVPFEVKLPTTQDPVFQARDFGIGLSPEDIENVYKTLFRSTKEESDFTVGRYGLGSKTPFAYTDTFQVTSIFDGVKTYYSAVIASDGIPDMHTMGQEETQEGNGVTVSFAVNYSDFRAFRDAAKSVSLGFDVKPMVVNEPDFEWPDRGYEIIPGIWSSSARSGLFAKMGPVLYPINIDAFSKISADEDVIKFFKFLENSYQSAIFDFALGDLEMSASRESLSYGRDDPTVYSLEKKYHEIKEIFNDMIKNILNEDDIFKASNEYRKNFYNSKVFEFFAIKADKKHVKSGLILSKTDRIEIEGFSEKLNIAQFSSDHGHFSYNQKIVNKIAKRNFENVAFVTDSKKIKSIDDVEIYIGNTDFRDKTRMNVHWRSFANRVTQSIGKEKAKEVIVFNVFDNADAVAVIDKLSLIFGVDKIKWAGEIPRIKEEKVIKAKLPIEDLFGEAITYSNDIIDYDEIKENSDKYRFVYTRGGNKSSDFYFAPKIFETDVLKNKFKIVFVNAAQRNILKKEFGIVALETSEFTSYIEKNIFDLVSDKAMENYKQYRETDHNIDYENERFHDSIAKLIEFVSEYITSSKTREWMQDFTEKKSNKENYSCIDLFTLMEKCDMNIYIKKKPEDEVEKFFNQNEDLKFVKDLVKNLSSSYYSNIGNIFKNEVLKKTAQIFNSI